jgi:hypothetical protein
MTDNLDILVFNKLDNLIKFSNNVPHTLYKFRNWDNELHKTIITENKLYLANPITFEDGFDCRIPNNYKNISEIHIIENLTHLYVKQHPSYNEKAIEKLVKDDIEKAKNIYRDEEALKKFQEKSLIDVIDHYGILSLTTDKKNDKMWEEYAGNYKGFCVGIDQSFLLEQHNNIGQFGPVKYLEKIKEINIEKSLVYRSIERFYSKYTKYEFEKEFRLVKTFFEKKDSSDPERFISVDNKYYKEIILGKCMNEKNKSEIRAIAKKFPNLTIIEQV